MPDMHRHEIDEVTCREFVELVTDEAELAGIPADVVEAARAEKREGDGGVAASERR